MPVLGEADPGSGDIFNALLQRDAAMQMCPERGKQNELAGARHYLDFLVSEFGLATRTRHIVEVPDGHELTLTEGPRAAVHVPVVKLTGIRALQVVAPCP